MILCSTYLHARNKIIPFLQIPAISLFKPRNNGPVLKFLQKFKIIHLVMFWKIAPFHARVSIKLTYTIPYSSVAIGVDSCCVVITQLIGVLCDQPSS